MNVDFEVVLPVATLVLGLLLGYALDWHREKRLESRQRQERRRITQWQMIMNVQNLAWELHKIETELQWAMGKHFRETETWPSADSRDYEHDRATAIAAIDVSTKLMSLQTRLDDKELKESIRVFNGVTRQMMTATDPEDAHKKANISIQAMRRLNKRTAQLLDGLY